MVGDGGLSNNFDGKVRLKGDDVLVDFGGLSGNSNDTMRLSGEVLGD